MIIATYSDRFHADDVASVAMLLMLYPDALVIRTRDRDEMNNADICVDVGNRYDGVKWFDHHKCRTPKRKGSRIKYSSAGLVWNKFGRRIVEQFNVKKEIIDDVVKHVDEHVIMFIDAVDNGHSVYKPSALNSDQIVTISTIVNVFNATQYDDEDSDRMFYDAVKVICKILEREIKNSIDIIVSRREMMKVDSGSRVMAFDEKLRWRENIHLFPHVDYIVMPSNSGSLWVATTIGNHKFPRYLRGTVKEQLVEITGIESAIFVSRNGEVAGASTKDGAIQLATLSIS